eukprot:366179-Chlamydomonas_euryale.AAC.2
MRLRLAAGLSVFCGAPLHALLWVTADSLGLHALVMQWQALHDMTTICLISPSSPLVGVACARHAVAGLACHDHDLPDLAIITVLIVFNQQWLESRLPLAPWLVELLEKCLRPYALAQIRLAAVRIQLSGRPAPRPRRGWELWKGPLRGSSNRESRPPPLPRMQIRRYIVDFTIFAPSQVSTIYGR